MRRSEARSGVRRRGGTTAQVVALLAVFGGLGAGAIVIAPRALEAAGEARNGAGPAPPAATAEHREVLGLLADLLARSRGVIAVHDREGAPYAEIVLWLEDGNGSGAPDPGEIALLSHSTVTETIVMRTIDPSAPEARRPAGDDYRDRDFCQRFRASPAVAQRVIARGLSDLRVTPLTVDRSRLEISLTWSPETSDRPDKASTVVDVRTW